MSLFIVKVRDRQTVTYAVWNRRDAARTGKRRVTGWSAWRTIAKYRDEGDAQARATIARRNFTLSDIAVFHEGRRLQ